MSIISYIVDIKIIPRTTHYGLFEWLKVEHFSQRASFHPSSVYPINHILFLIHHSGIPLQKTGLLNKRIIMYFLLPDPFGKDDSSKHSYTHHYNRSHQQATRVL